MDLNIKCKTIKLEETEKINYKLEKKYLHISNKRQISKIYKKYQNLMFKKYPFRKEDTKDVLLKRLYR